MPQRAKNQRRSWRRWARGAEPGSGADRPAERDTSAPGIGRSRPVAGRMALTVLIPIMSVLLGFVPDMVLYPGNTLTNPVFWASVGGAMVAGILLASVERLVSSATERADNRIDRASKRLAQLGEVDPGEQEQSLTLDRLWRETNERLLQYHEIALAQAEKSFGWAQGAMIGGFVLIVLYAAVATILAFNQHPSGAIVLGALGVVSAALTGFVSRTLIRSQEAAGRHMATYFHQPMETMRFLSAERLIMHGSLSDERRAEAVSALAQAMLVQQVGGPAAPGA